MSDSSIINGRYKIHSELGRGGYGHVLKVQDIKKNKFKAIKLSLKSNSSLMDEYKILKQLQGEGVPKVYSSGRHCSSFYIVMELLGESLYSISKSRSVSLDTTLFYLSQCISRVEYIHNKSYLHRDIKPQQFVLGPKSVVYILDFGISKRFIINNNHISFHSNCPCIGSCHFASINSHVGIRLSRRDDLESLVYSAIYMISGTLPWMRETTTEPHLKWNSILRIKREIRDSELFSGCPSQICLMFKYVRALKFDEKPDYEYLRAILGAAGGELGPEKIPELGKEEEKKQINEEFKQKIKRSRTANQRCIEKTLLSPYYFEKPSGSIAMSNGSTKLYTNLDETEKTSLPEFSKVLRSKLRRGKTNVGGLSRFLNYLCM